MDQIIRAAQAPEGQKHAHIDKKVSNLSRSQRTATPIPSTDTSYRHACIEFPGWPGFLVAQRHHHHLLTRLAQAPGLFLRLRLSAANARPELKSDVTNTHTQRTSPSTRSYLGK